MDVIFFPPENVHIVFPFSSPLLSKMKDIGVEEQMSSWLFRQLKIHLEQEWKYQPREKGLSLIECTVEVRKSFSLGLGIKDSHD